MGRSDDTSNSEVSEVTTVSDITYSQLSRNERKVINSLRYLEQKHRRNQHFELIVRRVGNAPIQCRETVPIRKVKT